MKTDLEIAQSVPMDPITDLAGRLGIEEDAIHLHGKYKAKVPLSLIDEEKVAQSKLILVTAMTPTPAGEGKTTTSVGLCDGLNHIGKKAAVVLREPSLGPCFGMKGGAAGGGLSQVVPMEDINLHFMGDFRAVETANNLLAALIDNELRQTLDGSDQIDPRSVTWKRVMDMNDRALRNIISGLGGKTGGVPREAGFNITAASEVMAILCLSNSLPDLKAKLGNIHVGLTYGGKPVYARDIKASGAMTVILKEAIHPNLVQTLEKNPAIIHGGPFANIAQGTNSILATKMGLTLADYVVTEAGFGADLGAEKFFNIKCRYGNLKPRAVVIVATMRALKFHGGVPLKDLTTSNPEAVRKGFPNLARHIDNIGKFGVPAVVALNKFSSDTDEEVALVRELCAEKGVAVEINDAWAHGGKGSADLAELVAATADGFSGDFTPTYNWEDSVQEKIQAVATKIYRAGMVTLTPKANACLRMIKSLGLEHLPICIAKTQYSFSDNPKLTGVPEGFELVVNDIEIASGAGFLIPITGSILRMPGLPKAPAALNMDVDADGNITGLI
ncbi:MAG: formate--tetrahydrofolate ligase [Puniceicoccaceae bacterium]